MRSKLTGFVLAGAAVALAAAPAASAPPAGLASYDAGATSHALLLSAPLLDLELTFAETVAGVTSEGPTAAADGTALATPLYTSDPAPSLAPGGEATNESCAASEELPPPLDLLGLDLACVRTAASVTESAPLATSETDEVVLDLGSAEALLPILEPLLLDALGPLADQLAALDDLLTVDALVDVLTSQLLDETATLVRVTIAPGSSTTAADTTGVRAEATSNGIVIELLPDAGVDPLLTIVVGQSVASVLRDPVTGAGTATSEPALIDLAVGTVDLPTLSVLGIPLGELTTQVENAVNGLITQLSTASPLACGEDGPLADIVCLDGIDGDILDAAGAAAEGFDFGAGTIGARSDSLHLELLAALEPGGAVVLDLATAVAAANAVPVQAPTTTTPTTAAPDDPSLARTGGTGASPLLLLGLVALAIAGTVASRRAAAR